MENNQYLDNEAVSRLFAKKLASPPLGIQAHVGGQKVEAQLESDGCVTLAGNQYPDLRQAMNATEFNRDATCTPWQFWSCFSKERQAWVPLEHLRAESCKKDTPNGVRTSESHPLRIDSVDFPQSSAKIGLTFCPGKKCEGLYSGIWARDFEQDMSAIRSWGATALVSLMEAQEFSLLGIPEFFDAVSQSSIGWHHLPIPDMQPPGDEFETLWSKTGPALMHQLAAGQSIVIHCRGGLGRTGVLAARILVEAGITPTQAIAAVRKARRHSIETYAQENYLLTKHWLHQ